MMSASKLLDSSSTQCEVNESVTILVWCSIMTGLACVVLVARIYARGWLSHSTDRDDYTMWAAMTFSVTGFGVIIAEVLSGGGGYGSCLSAKDLQRSLMLQFIMQPLFVWSILLVKISIVFCLLRFSPSKAFSWLLWSLMVFFIITGVMYFISEILRCRPLQTIWDPAVDGVCFSPLARQATAYANDSISLIVDLLLATLPIPMIWKVQVPAYVKVLIGFVMSLGALAAAACAIKINYLLPATFTGDPLFQSIQWSIWTTVECNIGIAAASIPSIIPLIKKIHALRKGIQIESQDVSHPKMKDIEQGRQRHIDTEATALQRDSDELVLDVTAYYDGIKKDMGLESRIDEEILTDSEDTGDISEMYANASRNISKRTPRQSPAH